MAQTSGSSRLVAAALLLIAGSFGDGGVAGTGVVFSSSGAGIGGTAAFATASASAGGVSTSASSGSWSGAPGGGDFSLGNFDRNQFVASVASGGHGGVGVSGVDIPGLTLTLPKDVHLNGIKQLRGLITGFLNGGRMDAGEACRGETCRRPGQPEPGRTAPSGGVPGNGGDGLAWHNTVPAAGKPSAGPADNGLPIGFGGSGTPGSSGGGGGGGGFGGAPTAGQPGPTSANGRPAGAVYGGGGSGFGGPAGGGIGGGAGGGGFAGGAAPGQPGPVVSGNGPPVGAASFGVGPGLSPPAVGAAGGGGAGSESGRPDAGAPGAGAYGGSGGGGFAGGAYEGSGSAGSKPREETRPEDRPAGNAGYESDADEYIIGGEGKDRDKQYKRNSAAVKGRPGNLDETLRPPAPTNGGTDTALWHPAMASSGGAYSDADGWSPMRSESLECSGSSCRRSAPAPSRSEVPPSISARFGPPLVGAGGKPQGGASPAAPAEEDEAAIIGGGLLAAGLLPQQPHKGADGDGSGWIITKQVVNGPFTGDEDGAAFVVTSSSGSGGPGGPGGIISIMTGKGGPVGGVGGVAKGTGSKPGTTSSSSFSSASSFASSGATNFRYGKVIGCVNGKCSETVQSSGGGGGGVNVGGTRTSSHSYAGSFATAHSSSKTYSSY